MSMTYRCYNCIKSSVKKTNNVRPKSSPLQSLRTKRWDCHLNEPGYGSPSTWSPQRTEDEKRTFLPQQNCQICLLTHQGGQEHCKGIRGKPEGSGGHSEVRERTTSLQDWAGESQLCQNTDYCSDAVVIFNNHLVDLFVVINLLLDLWCFALINDLTNCLLIYFSCQENWTWIFINAE